MKINPRIAQRTSRLISGAGPWVTTAQAGAIVAELRRQSERAIPLVSQLTGLPLAARKAGEAEVLVVDRAGWSTAAAQSLQAIFRTRNQNLIAPTPSLAKSARERLQAEEFGLALAGIAPRIFGQYDPYGVATPGRLLLVAPNILEFLQKYNLDRRDVCLWVCVHELTHAAQFAAAPWLSHFIVSRVRLLFEDDDAGETAMSELTGIMALLEGHAEYIMNSVPITVMPSRQKAHAAMAARRDSSHALQQKMYQLLGLDEKAKQYSRGLAFVSDVISAHGIEAFNRVWESALNAPTVAELDYPARWAARVLV